MLHATNRYRHLSLYDRSHVPVYHVQWHVPHFPENSNICYHAILLLMIACTIVSEMIYINLLFQLLSHYLSCFVCRRICSYRVYLWDMCRCTYVEEKRFNVRYIDVLEFDTSKMFSRAKYAAFVVLMIQMPKHTIRVEQYH